MKYGRLILVLLCLWPFYVQAATPLPNLDSMMVILRTHSDDTAKAATMVRVGRHHFYTQPDSSKYYFENGLRIAQKLKDDFGMAFAHINLGDYYMASGAYAESLRNYLTGLAIAETINRPKMVASAHNNISLVYMSIGAMDEAQKYSEKALEYYENRGQEHVMNILNNLGMIHFGKGEYELAEKQYRRSLQIREEIHAYKGSVLQNLGELMARQGRNDSAMVYFQRSLEEKIANNRVTNMVSTYYQMGKQYVLSGDDTRAMDAFQKGYDIAKENGQQAEHSDLCKDIAALMARQKDWEQAFKFEHEGRLLHDSIFDPDMLKDMSRLEVDYALQNTEIEKQELLHNKQLAEAQLANSRWLTALSLGALLLVLGLLAWIYRLNIKRAKINKDLNQLNAELEARVKQRTESLQTKTEVLEKHTFDLSHRVRGPVASILGLAALIDSSVEPSADNRKYLDGFKSKAESLDEVLHEINAELT
jgi:tetratricopeptide (TPR) repeat protein